MYFHSCHYVNVGVKHFIYSLLMNLFFNFSLTNQLIDFNPQLDLLFDQQSKTFSLQWYKTERRFDINSLFQKELNSDCKWAQLFSQNPLNDLSIIEIGIHLVMFQKQRRGGKRRYSRVQIHLMCWSFGLTKNVFSVFSFCSISFCYSN